MKGHILDTQNNKEIQQFIQLPFDLYKDNPCWVPPLVDKMHFNMNRDKHPTCQHTEVDFMVAESEGQTLGRLAVIYNFHHT